MEKGDLRRKFFIAIFPPQDVAEKAEKIILKGRQNGWSWDWKKKEDLHISLAFPGFLSSREMDKLKDALSKVAHKAFGISLNGIGMFFDNKNKAKKKNEHVLWLRPDSRTDNELKILHREITGRMQEAGFFSAGRDCFAPHVTLAKVDKDDVPLMKKFADACANRKVRKWHCGSFAIYESLSRRDPRHPVNNHGRGSKYEKVAEFPLP